MLDDINFLKQYDTANLLAVLADLPTSLKTTASDQPVACAPYLLVTTSHVAQLVAQLWSLTSTARCEHVAVQQLADFDAAPYANRTIIILGVDAKSAPASHLSATFIQPVVTSFWSLFTALVAVTASSDTKLSLQQVNTWLQAFGQTWCAEQPMSHNLAKQLAYEIVGKTPVIYTSLTCSPLSRKWQYDLNRLTQRLAWVATYSATTPNELLAWAKQPFDRNHFVTYLDVDDTGAAFLQAAQRLSGRLPRPHLVTASHVHVAEKLLFASLLSDFVAVYTACLYQTNLAANHTY